jgi:hypothetical protein
MTVKRKRLNQRGRNFNQTDRFGQIESRYIWRLDAIF